MMRRRAVETSLVIVLVTGIFLGLSFVATAPAGAFSTEVVTGQVTGTCHGVSSIIANYGGSTSYGYNAPASDAHPQFYLGVEGHAVCSTTVKTLKITVSGTYPDGTPLPGDRFTALTAYVSPDNSGDVDPLLQIIFRKLAGLDPIGITGNVVDLIFQSPKPTGISSTTAWGRYDAAPFAYSADNGLRFGFQLAVDPSKPGRYAVRAQYDISFLQTAICGSRVCYIPYTATLGGDSSFYCFLRCNPPSTNGAGFVSWTPPPTSMAPGQTATVSVVMQNLGTTTWHPTQRSPGYVPQSCADCPPYRLGSQDPQDNANWGVNRIDLAASIPPGGSYTFSFAVRAPSAPGIYYFQWRMVQDRVQWFGASTPIQRVCVGNPCYSLGPIYVYSPEGSPLAGADVDVYYSSNLNVNLYHARTGSGGSVAGAPFIEQTYRVFAVKCVGRHLYFGDTTVTVPPSQGLTIATTFHRNLCL